MNEIWKSIPGYEGFYEVSDLGRVRSLARVIIRANGRKQTFRGKILLPAFGKRKGYPHVSLHRAGARTNFDVHTLVALAFLGPRPNGFEVCHGDGDPRNANIKNLRYGTRMDNCADAVKHGTQARGTRACGAVLTEPQVLAIRNLYSAGVGQRVLAARFGVARSTISDVVVRRYWAWLQDETPIE